MGYGQMILLVGGIVMISAFLLLTIIVVLGRRAQQGRREGRYTSRKGNSDSNSTSSGFGGL
jgi:predicted metal-binding membrane protein